MRFQWGVCKKPGTRHSNRHRLNELLTTLCPPHRLQDKIQTRGRYCKLPAQSYLPLPRPQPALTNFLPQEALRTLAAFPSADLTKPIHHLPPLDPVFPPPAERQPLQSGASSTFAHLVSPSPQPTDFPCSYLTSHSNVPLQVKNVPIFQTVQVFQAIPQSKFQPLSSPRDCQAWLWSQSMEGGSIAQGGDQWPFLSFLW